MSNRFVIPSLLVLMFVLIGLIGLAAFKSFSFFEYEAVSLLRIQREGFANNSSDYEIFKQTQADLIKTVLVCKNAIKDPAVANSSWVKNQADPVGRLANTLRVSSPVGSEIIQLSLRTNRKHEAKSLLDAVVRAYITMAEDSNKEQLAVDLADGEGNPGFIPEVVVLHTAQIVP